MARQTEHALQTAWRALERDAETEGWLTIPIETAGRCRVLAGRRFRGGEEALLIGFVATGFAVDTRGLPSGRGFRVELVTEEMPGEARTWVALARQPVGSAVIFTRMAEDILGLLRSDEGSDALLFRLFVGRVKAWQLFMERGREEVLGDAAEVGLVGELLFLEQLLDAGVSAAAAVEAWRGPLDELHDFAFGTGMMEVKATVVSGTFPAIIGSIEQLDETRVPSLFLVGVRLALGASGRTLPMIVEAVGGRLRLDPSASVRFPDLVLEAGFLAVAGDRYERRFSHAGTTILPVGGALPRLTRGSVPRAIRNARYELDLDMVEVPAIRLNAALAELQVI